jgi:hypothetical protein
VRNVGSQPARVLLATQTRETIQPDQVLQ